MEQAEKEARRKKYSGWQHTFKRIILSERITFGIDLKVFLSIVGVVDAFGSVFQLSMKDGHIQPRWIVFELS